MSLDIKAVQEILPHRYPFLLIGGVEELEEGQKAVAYKNVTINEYFFQGHFSQEPYMPGYSSSSLSSDRCCGYS